VLDDQTINALFEAAVDATEEVIYNALCMAEMMVGFGWEGHRGASTRQGESVGGKSTGTLTTSCCDGGLYWTVQRVRWPIYGPFCMVISFDEHSMT